MRAGLRFSLLLFVLLLAGRFTSVQASHLRAADIVAERVSNLQYRITLSIYVDNGPASALLLPPNLVISDGTIVTLPLTTPVFLGNETEAYTFVYTHTFPSVGSYLISYTEAFRNAGILNINNSGSVNLHVETFIRIPTVEPGNILNSTPQLSVPPIDVANVGQIWTHNPGAFDPDGDSISFVLVTPKADLISNVPGYVLPNQVTPVPATAFTIDPISGQITWNAPITQGEYNIAFLVEEWRNGARIGFVRRDMQIIVQGPNNRPPNLYLPSDTCISAGVELIEEVFTGDPDGHSVSLVGVGGPFELASDSAYLTVTKPAVDTAVGTFHWTANCEAVQRQPYITVFKAEDDPFGVQKLATLGEFLIYVHAPAPTGLVATPTASSIDLAWNNYTTQFPDCDITGTEMIIYRSDCDSSGISRSACAVGVPSSWGFVPIASVPVGATAFSDLTVEEGAQYCYVIAVDFPPVPDGESYASAAACAGLSLQSPVLTNVDVTVTDPAIGEIELVWAPPFDRTVGAPFQYRVLRSLGVGTSNFVPISGLQSGLTYTDTGLNTADTSYSYAIELYDSGSGLLDTSASASSVDLQLMPINNGIRVDWSSSVPWSYANELQIIHMDSVGLGTFTRVDTLIGGTFTTDILGLTAGDSICFFVETRGAYCRPEIPSTHINNSHIKCARPIDTRAPCAPELTIQSLDCGTFNPLAAVQNQIDWTYTVTPDCDNDVTGYNIYFKETLSQPYTLLTSVDNATTTYLHTGLSSYRGCYVVTALDQVGNESVFSSEVCNDNCEVLVLPNVFTPNQSGPNETFIPIDSRYVLSIDFEVYNRWGVLVFSQKGNTQIDWNGHGNNGEPLVDGVYYYSAETRFEVLDERVETFKGWVLLVR